MRATQWSWFIDQQLGAVKKSGLANSAHKINVLVSMPVFWGFAPDHTGFYKNHVEYGDPPITFGDKIKEYIETRYSFVTHIDLHDISAPNTYEGYPLKYVYDACCENDIYVLYFHSKGATKSLVNLANWREALNYYMIERWKDHISALNNGYDVSAMGDATTEKHIVSGNFFWAKSSYIKTLTNPLDIMSYARTTLIDNGSPERYAYEVWIRSNNPKINWIHNTMVDHYSSYYFLEYDKSGLW